MRITVLRRGGLSVYGGSYDARRDVVILQGEQQRQVQIVFPQAISAATITDSTMTATTPVVSGSRATLTVSGPGRLSLVATMGDDRPLITLEAETRSHDAYGSPI